MFKFIPYTLKTLWRHRSRTILTVSGSAVALFVFCFVGAVQEGMNDLQRRQAAKGSLITFQANKFCPATSHLPQDYDQQIARLDGVREVIPVQVFTNNCHLMGIPYSETEKLLTLALETNVTGENRAVMTILDRLDAVKSLMDVKIGLRSTTSPSSSSTWAFPRCRRCAWR